MIDGTVTVGPNAVLAMKREGYRKSDVSLSDLGNMLGHRGIRKVLKDNLRPGLIEMKNSLFKGPTSRPCKSTARASRRNTSSPTRPACAPRRCPMTEAHR